MVQVFRGILQKKIERGVFYKCGMKKRKKQLNPSFKGKDKKISAGGGGDFFFLFSLLFFQLYFGLLEN